MARMRSREKARGFSLVELLVAMVFTLVLMAGLASVFKASLSSFHTSGEQLASARRNRMSIDMLGDDLDSAMMFIGNLDASPTSTTPNYPPFFVLPNMPVAGAGASDPQLTDEVYFRFDQAMPFPATVGSSSGGGVRTAAEIVNAAASDFTNSVVGRLAESDRTFPIDCGSSSYAKMLQAGMQLWFKNDPGPRTVESVQPPSGSTVKVVLSVSDRQSSYSGESGSGSAGATALEPRPGTGVVIFRQDQVIRYRIQMLNLDPANPVGVPCLVRDQGVYNSAGFVADQPQQIITENVSGFKVYLSVDSGRNWAGLGLAGSGFSDGWDAGIRALLDTQLSTSGRPEYRTTRGDEFWFRTTPTLLRVDVSTRTATQRSEYANVPNTAAYKTMTQSLVFLPRHSGLTY